MSERTQNVFTPWAGEIVPQADEAIDFGAVTCRRPSIARLQIAGGPKTTESVELFKCHAVGIDADVTTGTGNVLTMPLGDLAHAESGGRSLRQRRHAWRNFGQPLAEHLNHPRATLHGTGARCSRRLCEHCGKPEHPATTIGGNILDATPLRTSHAGDAVVVRENIVDNHGVGSNHVGHRAIVHQQIFEEPHWLLGQRVAHDRRELGEVLQIPTMVRDKVPHAEPAGTEFFSHSTHPGVLQHAAYLCVHDCWLVEPLGVRSQFIIGDRVPQQKTQPRRQLFFRHRLPMRPGCWLLDSVEKPRRRENTGQRGAERRIMLNALGTIGAVGCQQCLAFVIGEWPAPGTRGEGEQRLHVARFRRDLRLAQIRFFLFHLLSEQL